MCRRYYRGDLARILRSLELDRGALLLLVGLNELLLPVGGHCVRKLGPVVYWLLVLLEVVSADLQLLDGVVRVLPDILDLVFQSGDLSGRTLAFGKRLCKRFLLLLDGIQLGLDFLREVDREHGEQDVLSDHVIEEAELPGLVLLLLVVLKCFGKRYVPGCGLHIVPACFLYLGLQHLSCVCEEELGGEEQLLLVFVVELQVDERVLSVEPHLLHAKVCLFL